MFCNCLLFFGEEIFVCSREKGQCKYRLWSGYLGKTVEKKERWPMREHPQVTLSTNQKLVIVTWIESHCYANWFLFRIWCRWIIHLQDQVIVCVFRFPTLSIVFSPPPSPQPAPDQIFENDRTIPYCHFDFQLLYEKIQNQNCHWTQKKSLFFVLIEIVCFFCEQKVGIFFFKFLLGWWGAASFVLVMDGMGEHFVKRVDLCHWVFVEGYAFRVIESFYRGQVRSKSFFCWLICLSYLLR